MASIILYNSRCLFVPTRTHIHIKHAGETINNDNAIRESERGKRKKSALQREREQKRERERERRSEGERASATFILCCARKNVNYSKVRPAITLPPIIPNDDSMFKVQHQKIKTKKKNEITDIMK